MPGLAGSRVDLAEITGQLGLDHVSLVLQAASLGMVYGDGRGARESRNTQGLLRPGFRIGTLSCLLNFIGQRKM